jgi:peptidoglycan/LPS O-acetylase OafA/YrhL
VKHRRHWWLQGYLTGVSLVGLPLLLVAIVTVEPSNLRRHAVMVLVATAMLIAGELKPIPIARRAVDLVDDGCRTAAADGARRRVRRAGARVVH